MSQPQVIHWLPATTNTDTISSLHNYTGAGNLVLNSNQTSSTGTSNGPYVFNNVVRNVSFSSTNNLGGVNITVNGLGTSVDVSGNPTGMINQSITETIAGPNNNTVYTANIFSRIDSISIDAAANGLSAGLGNKGITAYIFPDYDRTSWYASVQAAVYNRTTLTYTMYDSLTKPENINYPFANLKPYPFEIPAFLIGTANATANQLLSIASPASIIWATIAANAGEDFYFTFLQQGTHS